MTVSVETNKSQLLVYASGTDQYSWGTFDVPTDADVRVYVFDDSGNGDATLLTLTTHYTVDTVNKRIELTATGHSFIAGLSYTNERIAIYRSIDSLTQSSEYTNQGAFLSQSIEDSFDQVYYVLQEHSEILKRAIQIDPFDTVVDGYATEEEQRQAVTLPSLDGVTDGIVYFDSTLKQFAISDNVAFTNLSTVATNIADVNTVASDLSGTDTIGTVAADLTGSDTIGSAAALVLAGSPGIPHIDSPGTVSLLTFGTGLALSGGELSLDADLDAVSGLTGTGFLTRTGSDAWALRDMTATAGRGLTISEPAGVGGDTVFTLAQDIRTSASPTFAGGTFSGDISASGVTVSPSGATVGQALGFPNSASVLEPYTPAGGGDMLKAANETISGRHRFEKRPVINAERTSYEAYNPTITRVDVDQGSNLYRHVPAIAVKSPSQLVAAYIYNNSSDAESQTGQTVGFRRSSDNGATWGALTAELNGSATAVNPLDPVGDSLIQTDPFLLYDPVQDEEIALVPHRGNATRERAFIAVRNAANPDPTVNKWTVRGYQWDSTTNLPELTTATTGTAVSGKKFTYTIDGVEYDAIGNKPMIPHTGPLKGKLIVPITFITTFNTSHRIGFVIHDADDRTSMVMGGIIPNGELGDGDPWEPTLWQLPDGTFVCQVRNNSGADVDNHAISVSADLFSWQPFVFLDEDIHLNRMLKFRVRDGLYLGAGVSDDTLRNHMALHASGDGRNWVHGLQISDETDGTELTHYIDLAFTSDTVYALYSDEENAGAAPAPNTIRLARFALPTLGELPIMASAKNVYEIGSGTAPSFSGDILTIPPQQIASAAPIGNAAVYTVRARVDTAPNSNPYHLVSIGDEASGYFRIEIRNNGGTAELWAGGVKVQDLADETEFRDYSIAVDMARGVVSALGQQRSLSKFARIYFGDTDTDTGAAQAGNILIDCAGCYVTEYDSDALHERFFRRDPDIRSLGSLTKAQAKALLRGSVAPGDTIILASDPERSAWWWDASDVSALVTADSLEGMIFPPDYDQTGASGAWRRSVAPLADGIVAAAYFGAVGYAGETAAASGTDSAPAIQAAVDYLSTTVALGFRGGTVVIGPGRYRVGSEVDVALDSIAIQGAGMFATTLVGTATSDAVFRFRRDNPRLYNLTISASSARQAATGEVPGIRLEAEDVADNSDLRILHFHFQGVRVVNQPSHGVAANGAVSGLVDGCDISANGGHGFAIADDVYGRINDAFQPGLIDIRGGNITQNAGHAVCTAPVIVSVSSIDTSADTLTMTDHKFATGEEVVAGTSDAGLTAGTKYFTRRIDANTVSLHTSSGDASTDTARVNITGVVGSQTLQPTITSPAVRLRLLNVEINNNAPTLVDGVANTVRLTDDQIYFRGAEFFMDGSVVKGNDETGAALVSGRNIKFGVNRFGGCTSPMFTITSHDLATEDVSFEGINIFDPPGAYNPLILVRTDGADEPRDISVDAVMGGTVTQLIATDSTMGSAGPSRVPGLRGIAPLVLYASADLTRNNTTNLAVIPGMQFWLYENERVYFEANFSYSGTGTADISFQVVVPSGATHESAINGGGGKLGAGDTFDAQPTVSGTGLVTMGANAARRSMTLAGYVQNGSTAGFVSFRARQLVAEATDTVVHAGLTNVKVYRRPLEGG